jgi:non-heme chloroperoxidase
MAESASTSKPIIVLVHGLWMTPLSWEQWIPYLEAKGYEVLAPGWPGVDERTPEQIRANPKPMADKTMGDIVDHYASIIEKLPSPPIIIGHSFGGLFAQMLLSRGYGCAGIGLCPAQPAGIFALPFSTIKATLPVLSNPFNIHSTVRITAEQFHYCFGNHLSREASDVLYERYAIPSVAHVLWQEALGMLNKHGAGQVDFGKEDRAPLLLVAGTKDHLVSEGTAVKGLEAYKKGKSNALVELKVFEGRSHGIVAQDGWQEVADYAVAFAEKHIEK